jgi:hypothetical protein
MTITLSYTENCAVLTFPESEVCRNLYVTLDDMKEIESKWYPMVHDLNRVAVVDPGRLIIVHVGDLGLDGNDATTTVPALVLHMDTKKFFRVVRELYNKNVSTTLDTSKFSGVRKPAPILTVMQMINHPNASENSREYFGQTLVHFRKNLCPDQWVRFVQEMSRRLTCSYVIAQRTEFYFDGRKHPQGCGFNGGFIIHGNEFGIHT